MSITWQVRSATAQPVEVECYETLDEAIGAMAGHDGCGGVWEEDRESRIKNVDTLVDDDTGQVLAVAAYTPDDSLMILVPGPENSKHTLHLYTQEEALKISAERQANDESPAKVRAIEEARRLGAELGLIFGFRHQMPVAPKPV